MWHHDQGRSGTHRVAEDDRSPFGADLRKYYRICFRSESPLLGQRLRLWITHFGLHCVAVYRFDRFARRLATRLGWLGAPIALVASVLGHAMELVHHVRIYGDIGPGFYIGHAGMIFVGPASIGRNFSLTHGVTIGFGHTEGGQGYPSIGDDVWVGTGSVLSGAIRVGNGATIANGTMLSRSVPDRALIAGNPGRVVLQGYENGRLLGALDSGIATSNAEVAPQCGAESTPARTTGALDSSRSRQAS